MDSTASTTIVVFLLLLPRLCSWADDKIELGEQLLPGQTRASDGGAFVFGFFSPSNSTPETVHRHMVQHHRPHRGVGGQPGSSPLQHVRLLRASRAPTAAASSPHMPSPQPPRRTHALATAAARGSRR
ncbi:hypothetical protein DAI22_12g161101 [Oryza sativa Japonica Group]|nr:hypothetical protein DAI22_12g161101 [Oryza sativa Japonica Group]